MYSKFERGRIRTLVMKKVRRGKLVIRGRAFEFRAKECGVRCCYVSFVQNGKRRRLKRASTNKTYNRSPLLLKRSLILCFVRAKRLFDAPKPILHERNKPEAGLSMRGSSNSASKNRKTS